MASIDEVRIRDLRALVGAAAICSAGKLLYPAPTKRLQRLGKILDRRLLTSSGQELTETGWAMVPRAASVVTAADALLDEGFPVLNPREQDNLIAMACLEWGLSAMRCDLTDEERERALKIIKVQ